MLMAKAHISSDKYVLGADVPGRKRCLRFYFGGMEQYRGLLLECVKNSFSGVRPFVDGWSDNAVVLLPSYYYNAKRIKEARVHFRSMQNVRLGRWSVSASAQS